MPSSEGQNPSSQVPEAPRLTISKKLRKQQKLIEAQDAALELVQRFFQSSEGNILRAWIRHFDKDYSFSISQDEFCDGMDRLGYKGQPDEIFRQLDIDDSGEITLDEISPDLAQLWMSFQKWCSKTFQDPEDMIFQLGDGESPFVLRKDFHSNMVKLGWSEPELRETGFREGEDDSEVSTSMLVKDLIFDSLWTEGKKLTAKDLDWLLIDKQRQTVRVSIRRVAIRRQAERTRERHRQAAIVVQFRTFLKRKVSGSLIRAWRRSLDTSSTMSVYKAELWKAAKDMGWTGDLRVLWKSLDKDGSGVIEIQELDMKSAVMLADFKAWIMRKYKTTASAFENLDPLNAGRLYEADFIRLCDKAGFQVKKALFQGLDWQANGCVKPADLEFIDSWRCPTYLTCKPSDEDAKAFKKCLLKFYKCNLKAWRDGLDCEHSNRVTWPEFNACADKIHFKGDRAGAWRSLNNGAAFITYHEIDPEGSECIRSLRAWADEEFGDLTSALQVFDHKDSGYLNFTQFQKSLMSYSYPGGKIKKTFTVLDMADMGLVSRAEVAFIDEWERPTAVFDKLDDVPETMIQEELEANSAPRPSQILVNKACSPRIAELAQPRVPHTSTPRPPSPGARTMRGIRIGALKDEILKFPDTKLNTKVWNDKSHLPFMADILSIKEKTQALRNRTLDLLGKDQETATDLGSPILPVAKVSRGDRLPYADIDRVKEKTQALRHRTDDLVDKDKDLQARHRSADLT
mmetsp:Transcript_105665/g.187900  ORF Transcript_105665/g.187900 Transcript_105665/m.187900 type:complete len:742 (+) Transcript_105665:105-2330(+)|eukprot:CAMPEP_0197630522 /NCGR_PEP_ID=MMETSP1338-20131121/7978_1 /TAXON_ID=43686 ORGANISM="Pelagodinium beii, Strain RCC1491" /NCGR_SAMPLE_ID=MMETSP1338 /ASSEMBLY_ACC=CAM_ASM_000754 /LENGTH=741 /DNA_ID=CAMNT_0043201757 /DNA_START=48 /DNA_END=2273 /DNA_ORIENTATION=+